ncbi:MAG: alpha-amylase family glycosyl hydrolase [Ignavibacteriaceae bacterium]
MITYYFHVSKESRIKYEFEESLFSVTGDLIIKDAKTARILTERINKKRRDEGKNDQLITVGQLNALGLMHEIFHLLIRRYEETENPGVFGRNLEFLDGSLTSDEVDKILLTFVEEFPPLPVYKDHVTPHEYLKGSTENKTNREIILEELILLNLENLNLSTNQLKELYSDEKLVKNTKYNHLIETTEKFFENEIPVGEGGLNLFSFLRKPITSSPYNIHEQLEFIRTNWGIVLDEQILDKLLRGKDLIQEDFKLYVQHGGGEKGTPPVPTYEFDREYFESLKQKFEEGKKLTEAEYQYYQLEFEKFTEDIDWMPRVVMIAKNAPVWLYQLSKKYGRDIKHLDQIPEDELDQLAKWNFTSLWLIGIWERSSASKKIKQMMGNPEAASSAYSLFDYVIAKDLGGEDSFNILKDRAWKRGIRLASDMVPNHTGIYSKWVVEKPDYFLQSTSPPYPGYKFTGPNLSDDERVEVRIEDQYYSRTDAAVVFERSDRYTGDKKYIYHGNDGTNMPWNDTAQLNLLLPEVRESLIQTIMHVARKTPIIRFDAAMTLAKKHYQRLWFPIPGSGGAIPSRSDYAMTRSQFDDAMPEEFWRGVVDRINAEMPGTLLLAEAFWLMEGYFVRTLGMHRVYNSAFMHMLMKEENEKYKLLIKNTLNFNPEILKRYVNFMSNPDEETAVNQFGKGDKYFGVAILLVTLPGLPMFAHGQIQGFSEKYGMEYQRSYYNEFEDENLINRHQHEIFPLMQKRHLFSQVEFFELYDFIAPNGDINENVFVYTNRSGNETALVLFNNSYAEAFGNIRHSSDKVQKNNSLSNTNISSALGLNNSHSFFYSYRDHITNKYFLISGEFAGNDGLHFHLNGYQTKVLLEFRELFDSEGSYKRLYDYLNGRGVDSIEQAMMELNLAPFHHAMLDLFSTKHIGQVSNYITEEEKELTDDFISALNIAIEKLNTVYPLNSDKSILSEKILGQFNMVKFYNSTIDSIKNSKRKPKWFEKAEADLPDYKNEQNESDKNFLIVYIIIRILIENKIIKDGTLNTYRDLMLWKPLFEIFSYLGLSSDSGIYYNLLIVLSECPDIPVKKKTVKTKPDLRKKGNKSEKQSENNELAVYLNSLFEKEIISNFLLINEYKNEKYFNKERFNELIKWLILKSCLNSLKSKDKRSNQSNIRYYTELKTKLLTLSEKTGFNITQFLEELT